MKHERNNLMKHSLEKWGRAPIILGVLEHPLFWGLEHPFSRRARALTIQRGTSTHCSKMHKHSLFKDKQAESKWAIAKWTWKKWVHENALLKKWGRAPIIFGGSSTHLFEGSSTHFLEGHEHSLFKEQSNGERVNKCKMNHERKKVHEMLPWKMGARTHYFWGLEHPLFWGLEHSSFRRARALTIPRTLN